MEHLVQSHMGGYYISDEDEFIIQSLCEQCFDRDNILISWEKGNKKEQLDKIIEFLNTDVVLTYEDIIRYIDIDNEDVKEELESYIDYFTSNKRQIIEDIKEYISKRAFNLLNKYIDDNEKKQIEFVDNFDYSQILNQKVKKISYNKKHHN